MKGLLIITHFISRILRSVMKDGRREVQPRHSFDTDIEIVVFFFKQEVPEFSFNRA